MSVYKPSQSEHYLYDFWRGGKRFSGSTREGTKRAAEAFETRIKTAAGPKRVMGKTVVVAETIDTATRRYWLEVGVHTATADKLKADLERLVALVGPATSLTAITDDLVAAIVAKRRADFRFGEPRLGRISPAHINRTTTQPLRRILTRARKVWKVALPDEPNWAAHILKEPKERVRELRYDEESRLEAAERDDYRAPRLFAQITGLRRREVAGLTWDQVDFTTEAIRVVGKGDKPHVLPMTPELREVLEPLRGHHPSAVFTFAALRSGTNSRAGQTYKAGRRYPITYEGLSTAMRRALKHAGIEGFRFHDLRHTAATRTLRATGNLRLVQRLLNHANPATTARYAHSTLDDLRAGMQTTAADSASRKSQAAPQAGHAAAPKA